ncbi:hypothetical protein Tco_1270725, partial [Tanacetum coccineum]
MSESEPGEMAPESLQAVVLPKFDMHIHTSVLTAKELKNAITEYCILMDLHPRLPPSDLTVNKLPPSMDINATVSLFQVFYKLCKQGHWFSFENKTGGHAKKCFKEHIDTDLRDDFPTHYNEDDTNRLVEFVVPLRLPPRHLLYVCGLTMACRHPELSYLIKDQNRHVITKDAFLRLIVWRGTVISKGDPIPDSQRLPLCTTLPLEAGKLILKKSPAQRNLEKPNSKIGAAREKKDQQNIAKAQAKHAREGVITTTFHHAASTNAGETATAVPNDTAENAINVEKEVVDLSGNIRVTTPLVALNHPLPHPEHNDTQENVVFSN